MIDYSNWEEKKINVNSLLLDPNNPRIPDLNETLSQRDLFAELVANDDVYELTK